MVKIKLTIVLLLLTELTFAQKVTPIIKKINVGIKNKGSILIDKSVNNLNFIYPNSYCPTTESRPVFRWKYIGIDKRKRKFTYELKIVEMELKDSTMVMFNKRKTVAILKNILIDSIKYPNYMPKLEMGKLYGWQVKQFENKKLTATSESTPFYIVDYKFPFDIKESLCCSNSLITNGTFEAGNIDGELGVKGNVLNWQKGYGKPIVVSRTDGCNSPGYIRLNGNKNIGSCIVQNLHGPKIQQGKHYRFSACLRLSKMPNNSDYAYIKVVAFNGVLPTTGVHPIASTTIANVGWSGKIMQKDWITFSLNVWTPNKNFDNIAIYCCTASDDRMAYCDIDKVCLQETKDSKSCDDYAYSENGQPIIDSTLTTSQQNQVITHFTEHNGSVSDLYSSQGDTSIDTWYPQNDPCSSIGGTIPDESKNININDTLIKMGFSGGIVELEKLLSNEYKDNSRKVKLNPIPPISSNCKDVLLDNNLPFSGRDIIFVHGLQLKHLCDRDAGDSGAKSNWPDDASQFYKGGYYKGLAENVWADHIQTWLRSKGYKNRVLIVSYNCSQPALVAAHAILTQIRDAMNNGRDVDIVKDDPRGTECFGRNAVIISHSTGGLVTDIAMSIAEKSKSNLGIQTKFGNVGFIPDNIKAHIAFQSPLSGSLMANIFLAAQGDPALGVLVKAAKCPIIEIPTNMLAISQSSILIDLQPTVVRNSWGPYINSSPVPTITIAGGHPYGVEDGGILNWAIHPGLDDGVVTMSSQSGNPNPESGAQPSGYYRSLNLFKVFDMGIPIVRANSYFQNQTLFTASGYVGGASIAYLSPTGMVQPVDHINPLTDPANRYNNHYSFLQSASDHYIGPRGKNISEGFNLSNFPSSSGFVPPCYEYASAYGPNNEESRCITDPAIYSKGLVSTQVQNMQYERTEGDYLDFDVYGPQFSFKCCPPKFKMWWGPMFHVHIIIWERRYHNMAGYECGESEASYVYKYVLRN